MNSIVFSLLLFLFYSNKLNAANIDVNSADAKVRKNLFRFTRSEFHFEIYFSFHFYQHGDEIKSVLVCETGGLLCNIRSFNNNTPPFNAQTVQIVQDNLALSTRDAKTLCEILPVVRSLELNFYYLSDPQFLDCSFSLLDELIVGDQLLLEKQEGIFANLLKHNTRIQRLTLKGQTNRQTYVLIEKHLKDLREINLLDSVINNDYNYQDRIFIPSVRKLKMTFSSAVGCHPPMKVWFGGAELQDLHLECDGAERNEEYFTILSLYWNITSLYAGRELDASELSRMVGKFPQLLTAKLHLQYIWDIEEFIKNSTNLQELIVDSSNRTSLPSDWKNRLEESLGDDFTVSIAPLHRNGTPFDYTYRVTRNNDDNGSSALTFVTSGLVSYLIAIHVCRRLFF